MPLCVCTSIAYSLRGHRVIPPELTNPRFTGLARRGLGRVPNCDIPKVASAERSAGPPDAKMSSDPALGKALRHRGVSSDDNCFINSNGRRRWRRSAGPPDAKTFPESCERNIVKRRSLREFDRVGRSIVKCDWDGFLAVWGVDPVELSFASMIRLCSGGY